MTNKNQHESDSRPEHTHVAPKRLAVLLTGHAVAPVKADHGDFDRMFLRALGNDLPVHLAVVDVTAEPLPRLEQCDAILVSGSASSVTESTVWMQELATWLGQAVELGTPVLGICFGHQILATALGGEVRRNPKGRHMGTAQVERSSGSDPVFDTFPSTFDVQLSHQDHVAILPPGAKILLSAPHDEIHAFSFGASAYGVQFHPEFDLEVTRAYIEARRALLVDEGIDPDQLLATTRDAPVAFETIRTFVATIVCGLPAPPKSLLPTASATIGGDCSA